MKNTQIAISALACGLFLSAQSFAECPSPMVPAFPDGKTATSEQMEHVDLLYGDFSSSMDDYMNCLEGEFEEGVISNAQFNQLLEASDDMTDQVRADYQEQIRLFESR